MEAKVRHSAGTRHIGEGTRCKAQGTRKVQDRRTKSQERHKKGRISKIECASESGIRNPVGGRLITTARRKCTLNFCCESNTLSFRCWAKKLPP